MAEAYHPLSYLTFQQTLAVLGKAEATLKRWMREGSAPPYVKHGGRNAWRFDQLQRFKDGDRSVLGLQPEGYANAGHRQDQYRLPPRNDLNDLGTRPVHQLVGDVERWKNRELYRRAQIVTDGDAWDSDTALKFETERGLFGPEAESGSWKNFRTLALVNPVSNYIEALKVELGWSDDPNGWQLSALMLKACREIHTLEARWRDDDDPTGMPIELPE